MRERSKSSKVSTAFNLAASSYDAFSAPQEEVAEALVNCVNICQPRSVLDIGCGTGHVAKRAGQRWPAARLTGIDSSQAMLDEFLRKNAFADTVKCDAEAIECAETYDLIFSSMLLQWLTDPRDVVVRWSNLLNPGGQLNVALPVEGSLNEWRELCAAYGVPDGVRLFPRADFARGLGTSHMQDHRLQYSSAYEFLRSLKKTGAHVSRARYSPIAAQVLRRLLASHKNGFRITFRILYISIQHSRA